MFPILLAMGLVNVGTTTVLSKATLDAGNPEPKLFGYDARNVVMGGGLVMALFGSPILAAIGLGAAVAAWNNKDTMNRVVTHYEAEFAKFKKEIEVRLANQGVIIDSKPEGSKPMLEDKKVPPPPPEPPPPPPSSGLPGMKPLENLWNAASSIFTTPAPALTPPPSTP